MMTGRHFIRSLYHTIAYNLLYRRELSRSSVMMFRGLQLVVEPAVHHPGIFRSGRIFADVLHGIDFQSKSVLDMGTGSGILALTAALRGADVEAIDKDPAAVQCTAENIRRNGLGKKVRVHFGDLFSAIPSRRFDIILFNPPYFVEQTGSFRDRALYGGNNLEVINTFAASAPSHLTQDGYILMIISTDSDVGRFLQMFRELNYHPHLLAKRTTMFETFFIYKFSPPAVREKRIH